MSAQHTPGPWHVEPEKDGTYVMAGDFYITDTIEAAGVESDDTTEHANARLIAASPEMLDALQLCKSNIASLAAAHPNIYIEWLSVVSAAIAKATGQQESAEHV